MKKKEVPVTMIRVKMLQRMQVTMAGRILTIGVTTRRLVQTLMSLQCHCRQKTHLNLLQNTHLNLLPMSPRMQAIGLNTAPPVLLLYWRRDEAQNRVLLLSHKAHSLHQVRRSIRGRPAQGVSAKEMQSGSKGSPSSSWNQITLQTCLLRSN